MESATIASGVVESNRAGFTGSGFVNYGNEVGSSVEFTVTSPSAGQATLAFRFANGTTANRLMDISVNGSLAADEFSFPGTGAWTTWRTRTTTVSLDAGTNTIKTVATTANGGPEPRPPRRRTAVGPTGHGRSLDAGQPALDGQHLLVGSWLGTRPPTTWA